MKLLDVFKSFTKEQLIIFSIISLAILISGTVVIIFLLENLKWLIAGLVIAVVLAAVIFFLIKYFKLKK